MARSKKDLVRRPTHLDASRVSERPDPPVSRDGPGRVMIDSTNSKIDTACRLLAGPSIKLAMVGRLNIGGEVRRELASPACDRTNRAAIANARSAISMSASCGRRRPLCSRHDAHFRLLSAQEKTLAFMGARVSRPDGVRGWGAGGTPPGASAFNARPAHAVPCLAKPNA